MKRKFFLQLACLAGAMLSFANVNANDTCSSDACCNIFGFDSVLTVGVGGGYRQDDIKWTVFPSDHPGTVVKEQWKGLHTGIIEVGAQFLACESILVRADFDYGWFNGNGKQSIKTYDTATNDLLGHLTAETSGRLYDLTGVLGYQFNWCNYRFSLAPIAGYSYHHQRLVNKHYHDAEAVEDPILSEDVATVKAHNTYNIHWSGPLIGFTTAYQVTCDWQVAFSYAYHWARFKNSVKERFPENTAGIPDESLYGREISNWGYGNEFTVFTSYEFSPDWLLGLNFNYKAFNANKGKFKNDVIESPMRNIEWNTWNLCLDIAYVF